MIPITHQAHALLAAVETLPPPAPRNRALHFRRERLDDALWAEVTPLLAAHWREIAHYQDIPLDPDREAYAAAQAAGMVRVFTARAGHRLVGYAVYFVRPNMHYRTSVQAAQDVLYLDPSVRGGAGARFIAWCDDRLAAEGIQAVYQHVKAAHDFGALLERMGYALVDHIYARRLD